MPTYHVSIAEAIRRFDQMHVDLPKALTTVATGLCREVKRSYMNRVSDDVLKVHTGGLRRSISLLMNPIRTNKGVAIGMPTGQLASTIARVQEVGATIRGKNYFTKNGTGPWLVFPAPNGPWMTPRGVLSRRAGVRPRFIMVKQVTIPPRKAFAAAVQDALPKLPALIEQQIPKALRGEPINE